jgi:hypothetical protein
MSRDYTKYNITGLGENLNKRQLVFSIVKDWIEKNNPSYQELKNAFPDEVQGSNGCIEKETEVKDHKRFNLREPLKIKNGVLVVISNQWGSNIIDFIAAAEKLGYQISKADFSQSESLIDTSEFDLYDLNKQFNSYLGDKNLCSKLDEELETLLDNDPKYISYALVFESVSNHQFEYDREEVEEQFSLSEDENTLLELLQEQSLISRIIEIHDIEKSEVTHSNTDFKILFTAYFCQALKSLVYLNNEDLIAEFIYSQSCSQENIDSEDWIADLALDILRYIFEKDIHDESYESECILEGYYFGGAAESGYDYKQLSKDLIDELN